MSYMYCPDDQVNTTTGQCAAPQWVPGTPGVLPPLSEAEGTMIAWKIVGCWLLGYIARLVIRALRQRA